MTNRAKLFLVGLLVAVAARSESSRAPAASAKNAPLAGTLHVCPDSSWRSEGEVFQIGVCVSAEVTGIMGYNVAVTFDSSVIEVLGVAEGPLPKSAPGTTFFWWLNPGSESDSIHVNGAILETTVNGPGELFTMTFRARTHGVARTTIVRIAYSDLRDMANHPIDHERVDGFVGVEPATGIGPSPVEDFRLECRPNPFGPSTNVTLGFPPGAEPVPGGAIVVGVYATDGGFVKTLFEGNPGRAERSWQWDGTNASGKDVASGVYFAVARTHTGVTRTKLVLIR